MYVEVVNRMFTLERLLSIKQRLKTCIFVHLRGNGCIVSYEKNHRLCYDT